MGLVLAELPPSFFSRVRPSAFTCTAEKKGDIRKVEQEPVPDRDMR